MCTLLASPPGILEAVCQLCKHFDQEDRLLVGTFLKGQTSVSTADELCRLKTFRKWVRTTFEPKYQAIHNTCNHYKIQKDIDEIIVTQKQIGRSMTQCKPTQQPCLAKLEASFMEISVRLFHISKMNENISDEKVLANTALTQNKKQKKKGYKQERDSNQDNPLYRNVRKDKDTEMRIQVLRQWLMKNINDPYPNQTAKEQLSQKSGLSIKQIHNWFANSRKRYLKGLIEKKPKKYAISMEMSEIEKNEPQNPVEKNPFSQLDQVNKSVSSPHSGTNEFNLESAGQKLKVNNGTQRIKVEHQELEQPIVKKVFRTTEIVIQAPDSLRNLRLEERKRKSIYQGSNQFDNRLGMTLNSLLQVPIPPSLMSIYNQLCPMQEFLPFNFPKLA